MDTIITLLNSYVTGLFEAQDSFICNLDEFPKLEERVVELSNMMAAGFLGICLTTADELIRMSGARTGKFTVQRQRERTLISSVGDVKFMHTLYTDDQGRTRCLLDELIRLPDRERFTSIAEAKVLNEAEAHSYQHAAESISSHGQTITRATVMNKVHAIEEEIPDMEPLKDSAEKRKCKYLYIEADEDHVHRQDTTNGKGCYLGKLVYLFEGKEDVCKGRRQLVAPFYFGGIYSGKDNAKLWTEVEKYIEAHYDTEYLNTVYISGDGAPWIKASVNYVDRAKFVIDRFHLSEYINKVARYTLDNKDETVERFYKYIHSNKLLAAKKLLTRIENHCDGSEKAVQDCRTFLTGNWTEIRRSFTDKNVLECSAEGHISNVLSERMSSRPMGWSEKGTDRMCKLRCYVRNYGRSKVIDLVRYRREKELTSYAATGTDGMIDDRAKKHYTSAQRRSRSYIDRMQATLGLNSTVRKTLAIREQINLV